MVAFAVRSARLPDRSAWRGGAARRATALAVTVLCLLLAARLSNVLFYFSGEPGQVPFTVALFVLPMLCAIPGTRPVVVRYRWPAVAAQTTLTWVPFAWFGGDWQQGIDGLLAGLVLLLVAAPVSWLLAGGLLIADVTVRAAVTGLPSPGGFGVIWVVSYYVDDALVFFGTVWLAQTVWEVERAHRQAAGLAVAGERLRAARSLQRAVGQRLAGITANAAEARRALAHDAPRARAEVAAAGAEARQAVAEVRALAAGPGVTPGLEPVQAPGGRAVIGARLASAVLVTVLVMFGVSGVASTIYIHPGAWITLLSVADIIAIVALQLYISWTVRDGGRPTAWPVVLAAQAVLVFVLAFGFSGDSSGTMAPFLAGSALLLVPGWPRWTVSAAVVTASSVLYALLPLSELGPPFAARPLYGLFSACEVAEVGLVVYGLSRLTWRTRQLEGLLGQLARMAAVRERLRVARDVHDLLGLGLSAIALKADLVGALIGRDDTRAAAETEEMTRVCAAARADIRLVTGEGARPSLGAELAAARQILASAGIEVSTRAPDGPLPAPADEVLVPVLREAVTNVLRHAAATTCLIVVTADDSALRLLISNDGVSSQPSVGSGGGRGLVNLRSRLQAAGGRLTSGRDGARFDLTAEIPVPRTGTGAARAGATASPG